MKEAIRRYQNRAIEAAQVIEELIQLAKDLREANARGEKLGLSEHEVAFYDALDANDSAVKVLGDETLREIARELVTTVRKNVTIDWTLRENVRNSLQRIPITHDHLGADCRNVERMIRNRVRSGAGLIGRAGLAPKNQ